MLAALSTSGLVSGPLKALGAHAGALSLLQHLPSSLSSRHSTRGLSSNGRHSSVYITDVDNNPTSHMPLLLGLVNYFERHMPYGGYACSGLSLHCVHLRLLVWTAAAMVSSTPQQVLMLNP